MNERSTFYLAAGAVLVAALALALALVATVRAGDDGDGATSNATTTGTGGHMTGGPMMSGEMEHGAAAPREGVPDATATRGGQRLGHAVDGDTWVFRLTSKPAKWEILPGVRVTAWTYNGTVPVAVIGALAFTGNDSDAGNVHTMSNGQTMTGPMHMMSGGQQMPGMNHTSP